MAKKGYLIKEISIYFRGKKDMVLHQYLVEMAEEEGVSLSRFVREILQRGFDAQRLKVSAD